MSELWYERASDLLAEPDPGSTPFLVESLIVEGSIAALVGPSKKGKTWTLLDLAIAVTTGELALANPPLPRSGDRPGTPARLPLRS